MTTDESRFRLSIKEGKPEWDAIGISGIQDLPDIQWKLQNIGKIDTGRYKKQIQVLKETLGI